MASSFYSNLNKKTDLYLTWCQCLSLSDMSNIGTIFHLSQRRTDKPLDYVAKGSDYADFEERYNSWSLLVLMSPWSVFYSALMIV